MTRWTHTIALPSGVVVTVAYEAVAVPKATPEQEAESARLRDRWQGAFQQAKPCPHDNVGCGTTRTCEVCKDENVPLIPTSADDCAAQYRRANPPALSPRQALGEALACVERARTLLSGVPCGQYGADAYESTIVTAGVIRHAYEATK